MNITSSLRLAVLLVLISVAVSVAGCNPATPPARPASTPAAAPGASRPVSLISPVDFFPPEQKRLAAHLNWHTGCFKYEYSGPQAQLTSRLETWTQGRPEPRGGSTSSLQARMSEISISVQEQSGKPAYQVKMLQSSDSASAGGGGTYARPNFSSWSTRVVALRNPTELKPNEEIPVWALCLFKRDNGSGSNGSEQDEPLFDQIKKSDWALVLTVGLNPAK